MPPRRNNKNKKKKANKRKVLFHGPNNNEDVIHPSATSIRDHDDENTAKEMKILCEQVIQNQDVGSENQNQWAFSIIRPFGNLTISTDLVAEMPISKTLKRFVIEQNELTTIIAPIGFGSASRIYVQVMFKQNGERTLVAVKNGINSIANKLVLKEAEILSKLKHDNVVGILGFVNRHIFAEPHELVLEYLPIGNLALAVNMFETEVVLKLLCDVCKGMAYIHDQKLVHRDLACRNVFLSLTPQAKIGDFGLCRQVDKNGYYFDDENIGFDGCVTSPEAYKFNKFSAANDVWSMGILCWALYFCYEKDYNVLNNQLGYHLFEWSSSRLPKSPRCPEMLHEQVVLSCLNLKPEARPTFVDIHAKIKETITSMEKYIK